MVISAGFRLEDCLHAGFLDLHAHAPVETHCRGVPFPDIERDVMAAYRPGIVADKLIQRSTDMLAASLLVDTDIVDVERLGIL